MKFLKLNWILSRNTSTGRENTHMVLVRTSGTTTLLSMDAMRAICELSEKLTEIESYRGFCQLRAYSKECCRPWSIPNYIALLSNKTSCSKIEVNKKILSNLKSESDQFLSFPLLCMSFQNRRMI